VIIELDDDMMMCCSVRGLRRDSPHYVVLLHKINLKYTTMVSLVWFVVAGTVVFLGAGSIACVEITGVDPAYRISLFGTENDAYYSVLKKDVDVRCDNSTYYDNGKWAMIAMGVYGASWLVSYPVIAVILSSSHLYLLIYCRYPWHFGKRRIE
jgi:hypothetical protein